MIEFPHPSRPGFYDEKFNEKTRQAVSVVVDALIPEGDGYPAASAAGVVRYLEERCSPEDAALLEELCVPAAAAADVTQHLTQLEESSPEQFTWLMQFTYHGYYSSNLVLATLNSKGYDYHGAPQPFGYRVTADPPVPSERRGSYIKTNEVKHV